MISFPEPPKEYRSVVLEETDKSLSQENDPNLRYVSFSTIATGGKSLIKSCKDLHLSRFICYKTLKPEFAENKVEQQRLIREARVSAMLQHPNTIPTYELGRDRKGNPYFTMKLVHGYTLRELLDYRERYDLKQLMQVILQIAFCLAYAHKHGVVHRDIKPENILVGPYGEVLLLDWGLAKLLPDLIVKRNKRQSGPLASDDLTATRAGKPVGTPCYMSPEQVSQESSINHRTDIYSLGVVIYEILCGERPTRGEKIHEVIQSVLVDIPEKPSLRTESKIPLILEKIAMRCLEKKPEARFQSMDEVVKILKQDWQAY